MVCFQYYILCGHIGVFVLGREEGKGGREGGREGGEMEGGTEGGRRGKEGRRKKRGRPTFDSHPRMLE